MDYNLNLLGDKKILPIRCIHILVYSRVHHRVLSPFLQYLQIKQFVNNILSSVKKLNSLMTMFTLLVYYLMSNIYLFKRNYFNKDNS